VQSTYISAGVVTHAGALLIHEAETRYLNTFIFNVFVFCQIFNEFNARSITDNMNVFHGLTRAPLFVAICIGSSLAQARPRARARCCCCCGGSIPLTRCVCARSPPGRRCSWRSVANL
jgi:hypothetical protein